MRTGGLYHGAVIHVERASFIAQYSSHDCGLVSPLLSIHVIAYPALLLCIPAQRRIEALQARSLLVLPCTALWRTTRPLTLATQADMLVWEFKCASHCPYISAKTSFSVSFSHLAFRLAQNCSRSTG